MCLSLRLHVFSSLLKCKCCTYVEKFLNTNPHRELYLLCLKERLLCMLEHTQNSLRKRIPWWSSFTAGVTSSVPIQGTKIPACWAIWQKKKKSSLIKLCKWLYFGARLPRRCGWKLRFRLQFILLQAIWVFYCMCIQNKRYRYRDLLWRKD